MHSAIRHLMRQTGRWPEAELGAPICQEDMLGTLMCLSTVVIENLRKLNIELTDEQLDDWLYLWRVVGEMLGCQREHLPQNWAEFQALTAAIRRRHHGPSLEGVAMTKALIELHADLIPGEMFDGVIPAVMRQLVGDQVADWLEIPRGHWDLVINDAESLVGLLDRLDQKAGSLADVVDRLGMAFLSRQAIALSGYERAAFEIPTTLREAWHIGDKRQT
jgi:hypothetical protein